MQVKNIIQAVSTETLAVTICAILWALWLYDRLSPAEGQPPFVGSWIPWVGNALNFRYSPEKWLRETRKVHGPIFRTTIIGKRPIFCTSRSAIAQIYRNFKDFSFTPIKTDAHHRIFGVSSIAVSDEEGQKKMFAELYRVLAKKSFGPMVGHISMNMEQEFRAFKSKFSARELKDGKSVDLLQLIPPLFYAASSRGMFGDEFPGETIFKSNIDFEDQFALMYAGLPFPWLVKRGVAGRDHCIGLVRDSIRQYETGQVAAPYFIQVMLDLRETLGWSSQDLAAYLHSYLFALTSNTIYAAYWTSVYVYSHPSIISEMRAEISAAQKSFLLENPSESPSAMFENLGFMDSQFPLLNSVINETLRLCSNGMSVREVMNDVVLQVPLSEYSDDIMGHSDAARPDSKGVLFKKGDIIYMPNRYHHLSPDEFSEPEEFHPKRFFSADDETEGVHPRRKGTFLPFGGGASVCSGRFLALAELKAMLIILLREFDVTYVGVVDGQGKLTQAGTKQPHGFDVPPFDGGSGSAIYHPQGDMRVLFKPLK